MAGDEHRSALVDDVERFHYMLLLALRFGWNAGHIFEVDLPVLHRLGALNGIGRVGQARGNASMVA